MLSQFNSPQIVFGWNALDALGEVGGKRAAVIGDRTMGELGFEEQVCEKLAKGGAEARVIGRVNREPFVGDVMPLVSALREHQPDVIVALGGGSVMDAAKTAWAFYEHPALEWQAVFSFCVPKPAGRARFVAIPTTSGTGSEVSRVAVLTEADTRLKRLVISPHITPQHAILDPSLTLTMPRNVTAHSALDALTHAVEALTTKVTNEFARGNALHAIRVIFEALPAAYHDADHGAREKMHLAATMASLAATNAMVGLAHGMDQVGPQFGVPHGLVCAILLPYTIAFHLEDAAAAFAAMGAALGVEAGNERAQAHEFLRRVLALERRVDLPLSFRDAGVPAKDYFGALETLVRTATASRSTQLSPRVPTRKEMIALFEQAYWGQVPNG